MRKLNAFRIDGKTYQGIGKMRTGAKPNARRTYGTIYSSSYAARFQTGMGAESFVFLLESVGC